MTESLLIKSANGSDSLEIKVLDHVPAAHRWDYVNVTVRLTGLHATSRIYNHHYVQGTGSLARFFAELAENWKGWPGEKSWESIEGDFKLSCTCDPLGHVFVSVELESYTAIPYEWKVRCQLVLESGQLDIIAGDANRFFSHG